MNILQSLQNAPFLPECILTIDNFSANCAERISARSSTWLFAKVSGIRNHEVVSNDVSNSRISFAHQALAQDRKAQHQIRKSSPKSFTTNRMPSLMKSSWGLSCVCTTSTTSVSCIFVFTASVVRTRNLGEIRRYWLGLGVCRVHLFLVTWSINR